MAAGYFLLVVAWSLLIPFNGGPDESTHLFLVEYLYETGMFPIPHVDPAEPFMSELTGTAIRNDQHWYYGLPYLYGLGGYGLAYAFAGYFPQDLGFLAVRSFNWLLAPVFALALVDITRRCGLRSREGLLLCGIVLLTPQVTFIFSYFNSDAFGLTVTTLAVGSFLAVMQNPSVLRILVFGCLCGLILCSKIYYYPALVYFAGLMAVTWYAFASFPVARITTLSLIGLSSLAGPVLLLTYLQFGDITGLEGAANFVLETKSGKGCYFLCRERHCRHQQYPELALERVPEFFRSGSDG